ncbi:haloacid dehalogenase-like hydrolase [Bradyrhizobium sp. 160]|uniref:haloacid dehalogenase-like hydrolase n=1 Tax=Bradyrhizobium sp. 160 TaxID=2782634 RepID=UPI001FF79CC3|nr:HAD family hydrolase [Bradyrhizobium sp. 160]MCK1624873.1 haloacid dehalogenase-like hydrolase [Bradyrhizobium sp. 160]
MASLLIFDLDETMARGGAGVGFIKYAYESSYLSAQIYRDYMNSYDISLKGSDYYTMEDDIQIKGAIFKALEGSPLGARGVANEFVALHGEKFINPIIKELALRELKQTAGHLAIASGSPDYLLEAFGRVFPKGTKMIGAPWHSPGLDVGKLANLERAGIELREVALTASDSINDLPLMKLGATNGRAWIVTRDQSDEALIRWGIKQNAETKNVYLVDHNSGRVSAI